MTETATIYKGDTAGPWLIGHLLDDGTLATLPGAYTCSIKVSGTALERAVTDRTTDNKRFIAALTPNETDTLAVGQYVVAIELVNAAIVPPLRTETHVILTVNEQVIGGTGAPDLATMELAALKQSRTDVWDAMMAAARGERVKEVWRDGRRVVRDNMSTKELRAMLDYIDGLVREQEIVLGVSTTPRRTAIGVLYL